MFALGIVASLAGTPLRIAEAAHDIGRALADLDAGAAIEIPDGGVGDDSGATIKVEHADMSATGTDQPAFQPLLIDSSLVGVLGSRACFRSPPTRRPNDRLDWLQRYRC